MAFVYRTSCRQWRTITFTSLGEMQTLEVLLDVPQVIAVLAFEKTVNEIERLESVDAMMAFGEHLSAVVKEWKLRDEAGKPVPVTPQTLANVFVRFDVISALLHELARAAMGVAEDREGNSAPSANGGPAPMAAASGPTLQKRRLKDSSKR
jgi:hypothetical protein